MSDSGPELESRQKGTFRVTIDLVRRFVSGDIGRFGLGLLLLLGSSGVALLQPWPLKVVLDCVLGTHPVPGFIGIFAKAIPGADSHSAHPITTLLIVLCLG